MDSKRLIQAPSIPADWTGLMVGFRRSADRIRLIQAPSIPADWTCLVVDVPHLNAGSAVGVCAGQDKVGPAL